MENVGQVKGNPRVPKRVNLKTKKTKDILLLIALTVIILCFIILIVKIAEWAGFPYLTLQSSRYLTQMDALILLCILFGASIFSGLYFAYHLGYFKKKGVFHV